MKSKVSALFCLVGLACLLDIPIACGAQEVHPLHWGYSGHASPKDWGKLDSNFAACANGTHQSPIDVETKSLHPVDLPPLQFNYNPVPLSVIDNGHTVMVNYAPGSTLVVGDHTYTLQQFHFHHPSEDYINGKSYPLEAHLVHQDADGHLAVVAVVFETGRSNPVIDSVWQYVPKVKEKTAEVASVSVNVKDMLSENHSYVTYAGSLTTPPCTEGVTWYLLRTPAHLSDAQLKTFAKLYPRDNRPIQPLNHRTIQESN
jgi:carbonic anhydrase